MTTPIEEPKVAYYTFRTLAMFGFAEAREMPLVSVPNAMVCDLVQYNEHSLSSTVRRHVRQQLSPATRLLRAGDVAAIEVLNLRFGNIEMLGIYDDTALRYLNGDIDKRPRSLKVEIIRVDYRGKVRRDTNDLMDPSWDRAIQAWRLASQSSKGLGYAC